MADLVRQNNLIIILVVIGLFFVFRKIINDLIPDYERNKRFYVYIEENSFDTDDNESDEYGNPKYEILVFDKAADPNNIPMVLPYKKDHPYFINKWNVIFAIINDSDNNRNLMVDKSGEEIIEYPFNSVKFEDGVVLKDISFKGKTTELSIHLVPYGSSLPRP